MPRTIRNSRFLAAVKQLQQRQKFLITLGSDLLGRLRRILIKAVAVFEAVMTGINNGLHALGNFRSGRDLWSEVAIHGGLNVEPAKVMNPQRAKRG